MHGSALALEQEGVSPSARVGGVRRAGRHPYYPFAALPGFTAPPRPPTADGGDQSGCGSIRISLSLNPFPPHPSPGLSLRVPVVRMRVQRVALAKIAVSTQPIPGVIGDHRVRPPGSRGGTCGDVWGSVGCAARHDGCHQRSSSASPCGREGVKCGISVG